jgi:soluble lytic murein transglycosylase-like protein
MSTQLRRLATAAFLLLTYTSYAQSSAVQIDPARVRADVNSAIEDAARYYSVDPVLVRSVVQEESAYNPWAISRCGAMGLMQLMPATAWHFGVTNPFNPRQNVFAGTLFLRQLLDKYRDTDLALAAYSAGPGAVDAHRGVPPYMETVVYINRITYLYQTHHFTDLRQTTVAAVATRTLGDHQALASSGLQ